MARGPRPGLRGCTEPARGGLAQCLSPQGLQRRATPHPSELKVMKKVIEVRRSEAHAARPDADPKSPNADVSAVHQKGVTENMWLSRGTGRRELGRDDSTWERPGPSWDCRTPRAGIRSVVSAGARATAEGATGTQREARGVCVQCSPFCRNAGEQRRFWSPHEERWEQSAGGRSLRTNAQGRRDGLGRGAARPEETAGSGVPIAPHLTPLPLSLCCSGSHLDFHSHPRS